MHIDDFIINKVVESLILSLPKNSTIAVGIKYNFWLMFTARDKNSFNDIFGVKHYNVKIIKKKVNNYGIKRIY